MMMNATSNRAVAVHAVLGLVSAAGVAAAAALVAFQPQPSSPAQPLPAPTQTAVMLHAAGLAPDAMAAAGVTAAQTTDAILRIRESLPQVAAQFTAAHNASSAASIEHDRLERLVRSGAGTQDDVTALAAARTQLQAATAQRDTAVQAFVQAAELGGEVNARLAALGDTRGRELPLHYAAASRPDDAWIALRHALASADIHTRLGEEVPQAARDVILAADSDAAVIAARVNLENNGPAVAEAWNQAVGQ
ncbi:MAG: hypothetical protein IT439_07100 [Phycisphaerales bacterium]|nr:hypothetical protein [Phycisphaerales bacterium]